MKRQIAITLLFFLLTGCATIAGVKEGEEEFLPPVAGPPYDSYIQGQPAIDMRIEGGIYYWKSANTWHVRFARPYTAPRAFPEGTVFSGNIRVEDGIIIDVSRFNASPIDDIRRLRDTLSFRFEIKDDIKGFDFVVQPVLSRYCVISDFRVQGILNPELVRLGAFMHRPESVPFKICVRSFE
ncbi:MAG: hypothetical protein N2257_02065 [Thermodesulfovibrionales bacterium]|nr:hypothetical protein [Thermodesulfovibrionales bacterium]